MREARDELFCKVPLRRSLAWSQVSAYARAMGTELYRVHCVHGPEIPVPAGDWKTALARSLELDGRERPPFMAALDAMVAAGVLVPPGPGGVAYLLYTDAAIAAHRRRIATTPQPQPPHNGGTTPPEREDNATTPPPHRQDNGITSQPQPELSTRKGLAHVLQIDREKEREKERAGGRAGTRAREAGPAATLEGELARRQLRCSPAAVVRDLLADATGGPPWEVDRWHRELLEMARKPLLELDQVLEALAADEWVQRSPVRSSPRYVLDRWAQYAAAPRPAGEEREERVRRLRIARDTARMGLQQTDAAEHARYQRQLEDAEAALRALGAA